MKTFGYTISKGRSIDMDNYQSEAVDEMIEAVPSYRVCIGCGGCTATCTTGEITRFNIRKAHHSFYRGKYEGLAEQLDKCMLCGRCLLVCPRGVNTRSLIVNMRRILQERAQ